jgi:5'(3')-deoxyribonucleotidase
MYRILVDIDMTLNKFWETFVEYYNKMHNTNFSMCREDNKYYTVPKNFLHTNDAEEHHKIVDSILCTPGFWEEIPIMENSVEVLEYLYNFYDVYIVTVPWKNYENCWTEKVRWIKKNYKFFDLDKLIFTTKKNLIDADVIIDDDPSHIIRFAKTKIIIDYPYNRDCDADYRVSNWREIKNIFTSGGFNE